MPFPCKAIAVSKYKPPPGATGLSFQIGDEISVIELADEDGDYLLGEDSKGVRGVFPATSVNKVEEDEMEEKKSGGGADAEASPQSASGPTPPPAAVEAAPPIVEAIPVASPPQSTPSTPSRQPSLPTPSVPLAQSAPTPSSPPTSDAPEAPKKPSSLRDRIAALNAQGAGALPPPVPRSSKPPSFARKPLAMPPPAPSLPIPASVVSPQPQPQSQPQAAATPSPSIISSPPPPSADTSIERSGTEGAMSAEDAKASIGKGGSLKDRIAALQGGFKAEVPQPPGRAPKPWKKKSVEVAPAEEDAVEGGEAVASKEIVEGEDAPSTESTAATHTIEKSAELDTPAPRRAVRTEDEDSSSSAAAPAILPTADEEDLDPEEAKKAALVARMASLGGQRTGMLMPALPKRAGPPRKKSGSSAPASPVEKAESEPVQEKQKDVEPPSHPVEHSVDAPETIEEPVVPAVTSKEDAEVAAITMPSVALLAGAGVGAAALATHSHEDAVAPEHEGDEDDFDTPSLPSASARPVVPATPPTMPTRPVAPVMDEHVTPPSEVAAKEEVEEPVEEDHKAVPKEEEEEEEHEEPVEEEEETTAPPTLPTGRPPIPASFAPPAPATSLPPPPPTRSVAPPPPPPIRTEEEEEGEEEATPGSPTTASRPAIPRIPTTFAHQHGHRDTTSGDGVIVPEAAEAVEEPQEEEEAVEGPKVAQVEAAKGEEEEEVPPPIAARRVVAPAGLAGMFGAPRPPVPSAPAPATASQEKDEGGEEEEEESGEEEDDDDEEEEEEEEDPEIAKRRAIAARMAKLGGGGMRMGPMFPPIGGLKPASTSTGVKKKKKKSKSIEQPKESVEEAVSPVADDDSAPPPPPRMPGGIPQGGFLLPGMLPRAVPLPDAEATRDEGEAEAEDPTTEEATEKDESEVAPPPLPAGRPSTGPPRRSVPVPQSEAAEVPPPLPAGRPLSPPTRYVEEPEEEDDEAEDERAPTPPPRRMSIPVSPPPLAVETLSPSTPPSHRPTLPTGPPTPSKDETSSSPPERRASVTSKKRFSGAGAGILGIAIPRGSMDLERTTSPISPVLPGSPIQATQTRASTMSVPTGSGNFKAKDLDLAQTAQWWRFEPFAPPVSVTSRPDAIFDVSESTSSKRGKTKHDNSIEVVYDDLSKTVISVAFVDDDPNEGLTSLSQAHFGPPPVNSSQLAQFSSTFGAQVFAAAHSKSADKSRGLTPEQFLSFCFSRATDLLPPIGYSFGIPVYTIRVTDPKSKPVVNELDEPRSGDIAVMWDCKFKHNLTTQKVGTAEKPGVSIVQAWDSKKRKLRTLEVGKDGSVGEEAYRIEDLKSGAIFVHRTVDRGFLDA